MPRLIVDKGLIEKAKEKLGDRNATIIAELLNLEDFNERDLKQDVSTIKKIPLVLYMTKKGIVFIVLGAK